MNTIFIAFVINYCAYCDMFKEQALPGIIRSQDEHVVVYNDSTGEFEHGHISNIDQYRKHAVGYPSYVLVQEDQIIKYWYGFEPYNFWIEYNER